MQTSPNQKEPEITTEKDDVTKQATPSKKKKKSGAFLSILIVLCIIGMGISLYLFFGRLFQYKEGADTYNEVRDAVITYNQDIDIPQTTVPTMTKEEEPIDESLIPPITVDFNVLKGINQDCVGWLYIEANELSFPLMHGETNDDYIYTTLEGTYNVCGSIFLESLNNIDFADPNTIIYGHTMTDGSMLAANKQFFYENAYEKSPYFWILTPQGNYKYKIFSIHEADAVGEDYTLFYGTDKRFLDWCVRMRDKSIQDCGEQSFNLDDHIVTISTCSSKSNVRRVIQGICISNNIVPLTDIDRPQQEPHAVEIYQEETE